MRRAPQPLCADNIGSSDPAQTGDEEVIYPVLPNPLDPDYIPMEGDTEEILDQMRAERQRDNDRWQSAVFRDQQSGVYTGSFELFVPRPAEGKFGLGLHSAGSVQMAVGSQNTPSTGIVASIEEKFSGHVADENFDWLFEGRAVKLEPTSLRLAAGNQAIGNAFTLGSAVDDQGRYLIEVGLKEGANRVRVKYAYVRQGVVPMLPLLAYSQCIDRYLSIPSQRRVPARSSGRARGAGVPRAVVPSRDAAPPDPRSRASAV